MTRLRHGDVAVILPTKDPMYIVLLRRAMTGSQ